jgi:GNAT superfamily N-acetyltransferase
MKVSFPWLIAQQTFPKTEDWHGFAAACGMEPAFFRGPGEIHLEQPTTCFTLSLNDEVCAVATQFARTCECGLWVAPSRRGQGLGRQVLAHLLSQCETHFYATVLQDNPSAAVMEHLLAAFGFQPVGQTRGHRIWRRPPGHDPADAPSHRTCNKTAAQPSQESLHFLTDHESALLTP